MTLYLPIVIVLAVALVLLVVVLIRVMGAVRRFRGAVVAYNARFNDSTGHLKARSAGLRVAMKETRARMKQTSVDVPSGRRGRQEDDRG